LCLTNYTVILQLKVILYVISPLVCVLTRYCEFLFERQLNILHKQGVILLIPKTKLRPRPHQCVFKVSVFVSTKTKQNIFAHTSVFVLFSPLHTIAFSLENAYFSMRFCLSSTLKRPKTLIEATAYDAFFVTVFKSLRFHLSNLALNVDYKPK